MNVQEFINNEIRRLAASGVSAAVAAKEIGLSYTTVLRKADEIGVTFKRGYRREKKNILKKIPEDALEDIKRLHLAGVTLKEIGEKYGVTRERIRQIVQKAGLVSSRKRVADFRATVAGAIVRQSLTAKQAADMFKTSLANICIICREHDVAPAKMNADEQRVFDYLMKEVKAGASFNAAAGGDHAFASRLASQCKKNGIKSGGRSRWDDFEERRRLLNKWRHDGRTWGECAELLSEHDGKYIGTAAIYNWSKKHMPHLHASQENSEVAA
jgi:transposase